MSEINADAEGEWLASLEDKTKLLFLVTLGHELTIVGRDSYSVQSDGLDKPPQLRQVNEIQHRVLACLQQILLGESSAEFQRSIASWVLLQSNSELLSLASSAWNMAKDRVSLWRA